MSDSSKEEITKEVINKLGVTLLVREKTDDLEEAIECMKRAILYDLNNPKYYEKMSDFYKTKKDYKTALEYITEAESIDNATEYKLQYAELVKLNRRGSK